MKLVPIILVALIGIVLIVLLAYLQPRAEGFVDAAPDGAVPTINETSAIPETTGGATTSDPTTAPAQANDVLATLDALQNFKQLIASKDPLQTDLPIAARNEILKVVPLLPQFEIQLQDALAQPDTAALKQPDVTKLRTSIEDYTNTLRSAIMLKEAESAAKDSAYVAATNEAAQITTVAEPVGTIQLKTLQDLRKRIQDEVTRLSALRSTSPTLLARIQQLEKLGADLGDIITSIERGTIKLEEIPISAFDAERFLKALEERKELPSLIVAKPATPPAMEATGAPVPPTTPQIQDLLEKAKYLKFDLAIRVQYDPKLVLQDRMISALTTMEKNLTALAVSETPIPPATHAMYAKELAGIKAVLVSHESRTANSASPSPHARLPTAYARSINTDGPAGDMRASAPAQGATFPQGLTSPDVFIRPGFVMNDDTIARRASASAFDDSVVGGADYKKRALDLCRQVQSAQLGDPASFGCIKDPSSVSAGYSWKGNYTMVCNRLGDTWGGWYPEMFGCPKYDPTAKFKGNMM